jgi:hypothetical protein
MTGRRSVAFCCVLFLLMALAGAAQFAWGQEVTAAIVGTITDPSDAPLKDAEVVATDTDRGTVLNTKTNDAGAYNITRVPVGTYTIKITATGFQTAVRPGITLVLNQTARIDMQMKIGTVSEQVEVTGSAPVLQTDRTEVSTIIDSTTNDTLPLATRNYVQLTLLAPGSVTPAPNSFNNGDNTASGGRPYINGNREQANNFILDGMDNNQVSDNLLGYTPAPDAIQEFNLITNNASAEFGNFQGGIISTTLKSGTNRFHGDLWEYFRNDKLNSNSWENKFNNAPRSLLRWNMFGGTIGGPIVKNKLFFFFDYQGQRFDHPSTTAQLNVFTAAERVGNFGDICVGDATHSAGFTGGLCNTPSQQLYDPVSHAPFLNNMITKPIDPVAQALFSSSLYPAAVGTGILSNATYTTTSVLNSNQYDIKLDFNATERDHIFGRYSHAKQHNPTVNSFALLGTGFSDAPIDNIVGDWSHTLSSNLLNDVRLGVNHIKLHNGTQFAPSLGNIGDQLGIANGNPAGVPGLLQLGFNQTLTTVGSALVQQKFNDAVIQASDSVVLTHNKHVFHTGFEYQRLRVNSFYSTNSGELGNIAFTGVFTSSNPAKSGSGGYGGADFYLGLPFSYGRGISTGEWGQRASVIGAYIQDDWRVTNNLTVNLGVRYEAHTPWAEAHDQQVNFDLISGQLIAPDCSRVTPLLGTAPVTCQKSSNRGLYNGDYGGRAFQPRIGFAWTPNALGGKTVLRAGFTISSYLEGTGTNLRLPVNPPFTPKESFVTYNGLAFPKTSTDQGIVVSAPSDPFSGATLRVWDPHVQPALTQQWNLTIQQQVGNSSTLQVGYVGQHGTHLMVPMPYLQKQFGTNCPTGTPPVAAPCPSVFFSGNPTFQSDISQISGTASVGEMKYDALQAVFQKRYSGGLNYQVAYTYSKCMTDNSGYYGNWGAGAAPANPYYQNLYNPRADYAPCFFDVKHLLSSYVIYDIPFGRGRRFGHDANGVVNAVVGGWTLSPIISLHTGFPLALYNFTNDPSNTNSRGARLDCGPGAGHTLGRRNAFSNGKYIGYQWFDASPYSLPTSAEGFGNCPAQGPVRGPGYADVDLSVQKDFRITEAVRLQFRGDFLNTFNRVNLNVPSTSFGGNMGLINSSQPPRNVQFALKLYY